MNLLVQHDAVMADRLLLQPDSFTYISDMHNTTSWLDHYVVNRQILCAIENMSIEYDLVTSDHRPMLLKLRASVELGAMEPILWEMGRRKWQIGNFVMIKIYPNTVYA